MPWNGSGVFSRVYSWEADAAAAIDIMADRMDTDTNDIAQGLMHCLTVNGETVPTANLPMANYRHTGASAGVALTDYVTVGQLQSGGGALGSGFLPLSGGTLTGPLLNSLMVQAVAIPSIIFNNTAPALTTYTGGLWRVEVGNAGNLNIQQNTAVAGDFSTSITALQLAVGGGMTIAGLVTLENGINVSAGDATFSGNLSVDGALNVGGNAGIQGTVNANQGVFDAGYRVYSPENPPQGDLSVGGNLSVTGQVNAGQGVYDSSYRVYSQENPPPAPTSLNLTTLSVSGATNLNGGLTTGTINCATINAGASGITCGGLTVNGAIDAGAFGITCGGLTVNGTVNVTVDLGVAGTVTGNQGVYDAGYRVYSPENPPPGMALDAALATARPGDLLLVEIGADGTPSLRPAILGPPDDSGQRALLLGA
jgi:hypothetical protein